MARFWGMDEAGYGPNLGPLVVALTCWDVPELDFDFWSHLDGSVCRDSTQGGTRLHVADSKVVHNSANGIGPLELSAWSLLQLARYAGNDVRTMISIGHHLPAAYPANAGGAPLSIEYSPPLEADEAIIQSLTSQLQQDLERRSVACLGVWASVVWPDQFNALVDAHGNKASVLTHVSLKLLGSQWRVDETPQLVLADRHGGRKFYAAALQELIGGDGFVSVLTETKERSRYRLQSTDIEFAEKSERHFPVAAASLVAKYLRELAMIEFNAFWSHHQPELRPTKGYPEDARRYLKDIRPTLHHLGVPLSAVWRER